MPLFNGMMGKVEFGVQTDKLRCELVYLAATFSSEAATVTLKSHEEITMTQDTDGVYDLVLPRASVYIPIAIALVDATADQAAIPTYGNWEALSPSAGTASIRLLEAEGEVDDDGGANSTTCYIALLAFSK